MRIYQSVTAIIAAVAIQGCTQSGGCPDNISDYAGDILTTSGIQNIKLFQRLEDNTLIETDEVTPVNIQNLELRVELSFEARDGNSQTASWNLSDFFIKPALACSPLPGYIDSTVTKTSLISNRPFGANYNPGEPLDIFISVENFTDGFIDDIISIPEAASSGYIVKFLTTDEGPSFEATELHRFTFSLELENGEMHEMDSKPVLISSNRG